MNASAPAEPGPLPRFGLFLSKNAMPQARMPSGTPPDEQVVVPRNWVIRTSSQSFLANLASGQPKPIGVEPTRAQPEAIQFTGGTTANQVARRSHYV
jgi:hypothetical protein